MRIKLKLATFIQQKDSLMTFCTINDGNVFQSVYDQIYPEELELKIEHYGYHASFLNLDITIEHRVFVYKLYENVMLFLFLLSKCHS